MHEAAPEPGGGDARDEPPEPAPAPVSFADVAAVARGAAAVTLSAAAEAEITASRKVIDALSRDAAPHYGVSTGFGALAVKQIPAELRAQLQRSLIRSHAAGSGPEVEAEVVRAMMLLRLSTLATGRTGVRLDTARALDLRAPLRPAAATGTAVAGLRAAGAGAPGPDRFLAPEIEAAAGYVASGGAAAAAESVTGPLR